MTVQRVAPAYHSQGCSISETRGSGRVTAFAFVCQSPAAQNLACQPFIAVKHGPLRRQNFQISLQNLFGSYMVVVILTQAQRAQAIEVEQSLHGFDVLNGVVIQLAAQLKEQERRRENPRQYQNAGQHKNVPERQAASDAPHAKSSRK
jgi:hypothetical protein